ncbi:MAG TPA: ribonuclease P protein component [Pirellulales bacterium]|nr:ribonuclease P protein component [Pirellulales bacterium]
MSERFLAAYRVKHPRDFRRAYDRRASVSDSLLVVYAAPNGLEHPRLGLSVSRKVGGAVVRNRWKRCLREAFRLNRARLPDGIDLIVIPRAATVPPPGELQASLARLAQRAARKSEERK